MTALHIEPIACLRDNYAYLIHNGHDGWLVDPSEPDPPAQAVTHHRVTLRGILATHHHPDHVGGIPSLVKSAPGEVWVAGHAQDRGRIPGQTRFIDAPRGEFIETDVEVAGHRVWAAHIPGHTRAAIAWYFPGDPGHVFTGDTMFAGGCGRLFEGTPKQMFDSLQTIARLPPATKVWFGHEYTAANLRFALSVHPRDEALLRRQSELGPCTTPSTVAKELATNLFVRARDADELAALRAAKDDFA